MAEVNIVNVGTIKGRTNGICLTDQVATTLAINDPNSSVITKVNCVYVSNTESQAISVTLSFVDVAAPTAPYKLASEVSVPANSTLVVISKNEAIYLEEGDKLTATSGFATGGLDVVTSYEDIS